MKLELILTDDIGKVYRGEVELSATRRRQSARTPRDKSPTIKASKAIRTAPDALRLLHKQGFFQTRRTRAAIIKKLETMKFNFTGNTLSMALAAAPFLSRFGKRGNYTFGQKYPAET